MCSGILSSQTSERELFSAINRQQIEILLKKVDGFYKTVQDRALFYIDISKNFLKLNNPTELKVIPFIYESKCLLNKSRL